MQKLDISAFQIMSQMVRHIYDVFHKKRGSTYVIVTLENLDGF